eukprot:346594_1
MALSDYLVALQLEQEDIIDYCINESETDEINNDNQSKQLNILSNDQIEVLLRNGIESAELLQMYPQITHNKINNIVNNITNPKTININKQTSKSHGNLLVYGWIRKQKGSFVRIPECVTDLCLMYFGSLLFDSNILTFHENCNLDRILKEEIFFDSGYIVKTMEYKLLYRASEHNYSATKFHELCDNKPSTVVIIKNEYKHVFGGYCSVSIDTRTRRYTTDESAFLFLLRSVNNKIKVPIVYNIYKKECDMAVCYDPDAGPCFGWGHDIEITDQCDQSASSYCRPEMYQKQQTNELCGGDNYNSWDGDNWSFKVLEYEVFQILK